MTLRNSDVIVHCEWCENKTTRETAMQGHTGWYQGGIRPGQRYPLQDGVFYCSMDHANREIDSRTRQPSEPKGEGER